MFCLCPFTPPDPTRREKIFLSIQVGRCELGSTLFLSLVNRHFVGVTAAAKRHDRVAKRHDPAPATTKKHAQIAAVNKQYNLTYDNSYVKPSVL